MQPSLKPALRVAAIYAIAAGLWILLSDRVVLLIVKSTTQLASLQTIKGLVFVLVMALLLFFERWRSQSAISRSAAQYRRLFDSHPQPMWVYNAETKRLLAVNEAMTRDTGYDLNELLQMSMADLFPPGELERTAMERQPRGGQATIVKQKKKDGSIIYVEMTSHPLIFGGQAAHMVMSVDVTDRVKAEQALAVSEQRFRSVIENAPVGIAIASQGAISYANPAVLRMFGYGSLADVDLVELSRHLIEPCQVALQGGAGPWAAGEPVPSQFEGVGVRRTGENFPFRVEVGQVEMPGGWADVAFLTDLTEPRRAEQALAEANRHMEQLAFIVNQSKTVAVRWKIAPDWDVDFISDNIAQYGYRPEEFYQKERLFNSIIHPEDVKRIDTQAWALIEQGVNEFVQEYRMMTSDGEVVWIENRVWVRRSQDGSQSFADGILIDITERRAAEEALRSTRQFLENLLEYAPLPIYVATRDHRMRLVNRAWSEFTGQPRENVIGRPVSELFPPETAGMFIRSNESIIQNGEPLVLEETVQGVDGLNTFHTVKFALRGADGQVEAVSGVSVDISYRKQAEKQIRDQLDTLSTLYSSAQRLSRSLSYDEVTEIVLSVCTDTSGISAAWIGEAQAGGEIKVVAWQPHASIYPGNIEVRWDGGPMGNGPAGKATRSQQVVINNRLLTDPDYHPWRENALELGFQCCAAFPLTSRSRTFGCLVLLSNQAEFFTPERVEFYQAFASSAAVALDNARTYSQLQEAAAELEQRVEQRTAQLQAANSELEAFSYSISHDLRAPLRAMDGFSRILLDEHAFKLDDEGQRYLRMISQGARNMNDLINDLLAFSRLSRQALNRQPVVTCELVKACLEQMDGELAGRDDLSIQVGSLADCRGDLALLKQVWINLLSNAIKFTRGRKPATIQVGSLAGEGETIYYVKDNGVGFDMRYAGRLFGVFQRLHRVEDYAGTGVGLAIVKRIVMRHGGRAWAEAEPDKGAAFYFALPEGDHV